MAHPPSYFDKPHSQSHNTMSRKRPRANDSPRSSQQFSPHTFRAQPVRPLASTSPSLSQFDLTSPSPAPLANTDYFLHGGLDTPGAQSEHRTEHTHQLDAERDYRASRFSTSVTHQNVSTPELSFADLRERFAPLTDTSQPSTAIVSSSWGTGIGLRTAWALTGGLAGKILNFCISTTFRGFRAGGGQAYTDRAEPAKGDGYVRQQRRRRASYDDDFSPVSSPVAGRTMKFQQSEVEDSATKNTWVLVDAPTGGGGDQSPARKRSRASAPASASIAGRLYSGVRNTTMMTVEQPGRTTTGTGTNGASYASPRSRIPNSTSTSNSRQSSTYGPRPRVHVTTPSKQRHQPSFLAQQQQTPVSPEVEAYQRKKRREEKKHDDSIKRLNAQLQDMIRQGQQALGSRVEIVDFDGDDDERYGYDHDNV